MSETLGLKNVNMLSKEQYDGVAEPTNEELWAVSGLGVGFPSDRYDDLTLGASGTSYTAPANGYFYVNKGTSSTNQYISIDGGKGYGIQNQPNVSSTNIKMMLPVQKGDNVKVSYTTGGTTNAFRFIYAEGEE